MGMAPPVRFLDFISLLVHVSPPRTPLPCRASFAAGGEFVWARVVLAFASASTTVLYCVTPVCILKKKHRARHGCDQGRRGEGRGEAAAEKGGESAKGMHVT